MKHKSRKLKKVLSMVLSVILIAGLLGGVPIRAMAEEDTNTNRENIKLAVENETLSDGDGILSGGDGTPAGEGEIISRGDGTPSGEGEIISGGDGTPSGEGEVVSGGDGTPSGEGEVVSGGDGTPSGADQLLQDTNEEYFQVNFYSDGVLQDTFEVKEGEKLSEVPEPVKEGYIFIGWAIAEENGEEFDPDTAITQAMDLYAKWEIPIEEAVLLETDAMPVAAQETSYSTDGGNTWSEGTFAEAVDACRSAAQPAEIRLLQDITLTGSNWDGSHYLAGNSDVIIDGRGHRIIRGDVNAGDNNHVLLVINQPRTVTLKNIAIDGGALWQGNDPATRTNTGLSITDRGGALILLNGGGKLILESGTILQNNHLDGLSGGAGVVVMSRSSLIMKAGSEIRNNSAYSNAAVVVNNADFHMEGGSIHDNYAMEAYGVNVTNNGTFTMSAGSISKNGTYGGSAIYIGGGTKSGTVTIRGGSISDNVSTNKICNPVINGQKGHLFMSGGNISGNDGGGVTMFELTMEMSGGSIINNVGCGVITGSLGEFRLSGNPVITGNIDNGGMVRNVHLSDGEKIVLAGVLTQGASIGVTNGVKDEEGVFTSGWPGQMGDTKIPADYFSSDSGRYIVVRDETTNEAKLVSHVHNYGTDWKWDDAAHWHECDCGAKADQAAHTEDAGTIMKEPTETETGEKVYKCTVCGHERIEILPATGGGSGDNKDDDENNQDGNGGSQGGSSGDQNNNGENNGSSGDQNNNVETGTNSINVSVQSNENAETAEVKVLNESVSAAVQVKEENASQKEAADGGTEPKTGEDMAVEVYATVAMIAGLLYLLSYFEFDKRGMTEAEKRELLTRIIQWSRKGGRIRTGMALAAIFLLLVYYHSIGKKAEAGWKEVYGE